jgi:ATP-dependent Clp protease ATP-binding subunit ClpA
MEYINKFFTPEFRNRLDAIIQFNPLDTEVIKNVVDKFMTELQSQLDEKKVTINASDKAKEWLAIRGYDEKLGARPMSRLIQDLVRKPLAEEILFGKLSSGGDVFVDEEDDALVFDIQAR